MKINDFILYHHDGKDIIFPCIKDLSIYCLPHCYSANIKIEFLMAEEQQHKETQKIKEYIKGASLHESDN